MTQGASARWAEPIPADRRLPGSRDNHNPAPKATTALARLTAALPSPRPRPEVDWPAFEESFGSVPVPVFSADLA
jgi:hypothetical protein